MSTVQHTSRSIVSNRLNQFVSLYDPGDESKPEQTPRTIPKRIKDDAERLVSVPLKNLGKRQFAIYRKLRVQRHPHCGYCGCDLTEETSTLDHVLPQSKGGGNCPANLRLSCMRCNNEKSSLTFAEWMERTKQDIRRARAILAHLRELIDSGLEESLPPPLVAKKPKKKALPRSRDEPLPGPIVHPDGKVDWFPEHFDQGKRSYWLCEKSGRKPILRELGIQQAAHFLSSVGGEGLELLMVTPLYRDELGLSSAKEESRSIAGLPLPPVVDSGLRRDDCKVGRRSFSIIRRCDRKVVVSGLRATDIAHYLDSVGFDNNGPLAVSATEVWHPKSGGEYIEEDGN